MESVHPPKASWKEAGKSFSAPLRILPAEDEKINEELNTLNAKILSK